MTPDVIVAASAALGTALNDEQVRLLSAYHDLLWAWSARTRLVSRGDRAHLWERHLLDSLACAALVRGGSGRLLDLGSGGGLPGIVLQIACPDVTVTLLEPARMKALFLSEAISQLDLRRACVLRARAENLASNPTHAASYDTVTARAVAPLPVLWAWARPLLSRGGQLVAFKPPGGLKELGQVLPEGVVASERVLRIPGIPRPRGFALLRSRPSQMT